MNQYWQRATEAAEAAEEATLLYKAGYLNGSASRAYYAMFNAARALLSGVKGFSPEKVKTHALVLRFFSQHFVQTGIFDREAARFLAKASEAGKNADYGGVELGSVEARQVLDAMQGFMAVARSVFDEPKPAP